MVVVSMLLWRVDATNVNDNVERLQLCRITRSYHIGVTVEVSDPGCRLKQVYRSCNAVATSSGTKKLLFLRVKFRFSGKVSKCRQHSLKEVNKTLRCVPPGSTTAKMDKSSVASVVKSNFSEYQSSGDAFIQQMCDMHQDILRYVEELSTQAISADNAPMITKTPRANKQGKRIQTIREDSECDEDFFEPSKISHIKTDDACFEILDSTASRPKRGASVKAGACIKAQQSMKLSSKMRREDYSNENSVLPIFSKSKVSKQTESYLEKSESRDFDEPAMISKENKKPIAKKNLRIGSDTDHSIDEISDSASDETMKKSSESSNKRKFDNQVSDSPQPQAKRGRQKKGVNLSKESEQYFYPYSTILGKSEKSKPLTKETEESTFHSKIKNETKMINETADDTVEPSMYEDAVCKPTVPVMNSTMNPNSTVTLDRIMGTAVGIEPIPKRPLFDETVTLKKNSFVNGAKNQSPANDKTVVKTSKALIHSDAKLTMGKLILSKQEISNLLTDDESSPERTKQGHKTNPHYGKKHTRSSSVSMDENFASPKYIITNKNLKVASIKSAHKHPLFSPYTKDSVRKRVEAFEQVAISPKNGSNYEDTSGRVTRNKTRALAATTVETSSSKLVKKSLAAMKTMVPKPTRGNETKENENINFVGEKLVGQKIPMEQYAQKPQNLKTTPLSKTKLLQPPSSVNRNQQTPSNQYTKHLQPSSSKTRIVSHVDSFIPNSTGRTRTSSQEKYADEKRRRNEEDARKKREELLRTQADEKKKKRQEKELKNKLAREAKEKLEMEKRIKLEKEKEEKARHIMIAKEKEKEEMEKRKLAQLQKAQEKEDKRRQEEELRRKKIAEQEEAEKQLAEQKRREQEAEKRKMTEAKMRAQQQKAKTTAQKQPLQNYQLDSDPDEEDSDDESKPKHEIPTWASKSVRQKHLAMQKHIPMICVLKFFDVRKCTPDLAVLFKGIDPKKLKRSSSAIWKVPPRQSMMNASLLVD